MACFNVYGQSKLLGEQKVTENMDDYYVIRISWLLATFENLIRAGVLIQEHSINKKTWGKTN